ADRVLRGAHRLALRLRGPRGDRHRGEHRSQEPGHQPTDRSRHRPAPQLPWNTTRIGLRPTGTVASTVLLPVSMTLRSFEISCTTKSRVPSRLPEMPLGRWPTSICSRMRRLAGSALSTTTRFRPATVTEAFGPWRPLKPKAICCGDGPTLIEAILSCVAGSIT